MALSLAAVALALMALATGVTTSAGATTPPRRGLGAPAALDSVRAQVRQNRLAEADSSVRARIEWIGARPGTDSLAMSEAIEVLLNILSRKGQTGTPEFRAHAERAAGLRERYSPPDDLRRAAAWQYVAAAKRAASDHRGALALYERALALQERVLGPDDLEVSRMLNRIGAVHRALGDRVAARASLERALRIREQRLPPDHGDIALVLGNLALMDMEDGDYSSARPRLEHVLGINEASEGPEGTMVGLTLLNLSTLSARLGDPDRARQQLERAIRILTARLGADRTEVIQGRVSLAVTMMRLGDAAHAEGLFRESLGGLGREGQSSSLLEVEALSGLAGACARLGRLNEADSLYRAALALQRTTVGAGHWSIAETMRGIAVLCRESGALEAAAACLDTALAIDEAAFGAAHPSVALDLGLRARVQLERGQAEEASRDALRAERIGADHLRATARALPERMALDYAEERAKGMDVALAVLSRDGTVEERVTATWDALVRSRAIVLDEMATRHRSLSSVRDTITRTLSRVSSDAHRRLANLFVGGVTDSVAGFRAKLRAAQQACDSVDARLAAHSATFRRERRLAGAGVRELREALPPDAALVAFARMRDPAASSTSDSALGLAPRYLAFVMAEDRAPVAVSLGDAAHLDGVVARWREAVAALVDARTSARERGRARRAGAALRAAVWDPLASRLRGVKRAFVVPDGALHLVNLAALPSGSASYLLEDGPTFHLLTAERDLLREPAVPSDESLLALGGADFNGPAERLATVPADTADATPAYRGLAPICDLFALRRFEPLPGSARETAEIAALWARAEQPAARILTGSAASEGAFKRFAPGSHVLHLATHAYFLGSECVERSSPSERARGDRLSPLLAAGLVMAGANRRDSSGTDEDGVLTAEEITALDLASAGTVALSACDSGLGSLVGSEGVFGLRRAFEIAGAQRMVLSLWKVGDLDARRWMRAFYEARLLAHRPIADAARDASLRMLHEQRAAGLGDALQGWGAFVVSGDWR